MKKNENLDTTIVNSITLGNILGITDRRVRALVDEGVINSISRGKYEMIKSVQQYCNFLRQKTEVDSNKKGAKIDYDTEHALHEKVKREKAELQLKVMKGELHRSEDVESIMVDMITKTKTKLLGIPSKAAVPVMGHTDMNKVEDILTKLINKALSELAEYNPEDFSKNALFFDESDDEEDEKANI